MRIHKLYSPKPLCQIVDDTASLHNLLDHGRRMRILKQTVCEKLPRDHAIHCQSVNLKGKSLTLYVDSPTWANRFRYLLPAILADIRQINRYAAIKEINIKTLPDLPSLHFNKFRSKNGDISAETIRLLEKTAHGKPAALSASLSRLAANLKKS